MVKPTLVQTEQNPVVRLADEVERHARAIIDAIDHGDGGEATFQASELLALAECARRGVRS